MISPMFSKKGGAFSGLTFSRKLTLTKLAA